MLKKRAWNPILMSIVITFLITIQAVTHVQDERSRADVNQDGIINILDLVIVAKYLGEREEELDAEHALPEPAAETESPAVYPEVTFDNVLELMPGERYRIRPTDSHEGAGDEGLIYSIGWGSIDENRKLREGFTADDPKIRAWFSMANAGKAPYAKTLDGKPVIVKDPVWDEIVIEIISFGGLSGAGGSKQVGGPRGNRFEFTLVEYDAILIENLTHPDRKFEYE